MWLRLDTQKANLHRLKDACWDPPPVLTKATTVAGCTVSKVPPSWKAEILTSGFQTALQNLVRHHHHRRTAEQGGDPMGCHDSYLSLSPP